MRDPWTRQPQPPLSLLELLAARATQFPLVSQRYPFTQLLALWHEVSHWSDSQAYGAQSVMAPEACCSWCPSVRQVAVCGTQLLASHLYPVAQCSAALQSVRQAVVPHTKGPQL